MDCSPRRLGPSAPVCTRRCFTVEWEVHCFHLILQFFTEPVLSHVIDVQCHAKSSWRLCLRSDGTHLEFSLLRCTSPADELDRIFVQYTVCLLNKYRETYFEETSDTQIYTMSSIKVLGQTLVDDVQLLHNKVRIHKAFFDNEDNVYKDVLHLRFELTLSVNTNEANERNCTPDLMALSNDIKHFRDDPEFCDLIWHSTGADYQLNATLLQARLPSFHILAANYDVCLHEHTDVVFDEKVAQCRSLKGSRTDSISSPRRCFNVDILAEVLYFAGSRTRPYPFVHPAHIPIPPTFRECFTDTVCRALFSYLYSGQACIDGVEDARRLSQLARGFLLHDLVGKLEECPSGCHTVTEMVEISGNYRLSATCLKIWGSQNFPPYEQTVALRDGSQRHARYLRVLLHLVKSGDNCDVVGLECRFVRTNLFPMLLTANVRIMNEAGEMVNESFSRHMYKVDTIWRPEVRLRREESAVVTMECRFYASFPHIDGVQCSGFKRSNSETGLVCVQSFRQLSGDLLQRLGDPLTCDVVLVAQGKAMAAHIFVLCARSRRLREELRSKRNREHTITHLLPGIDFKTLVEMVTYMYSGDPDLENSDNVEKLRWAAESFGVTQLKDTCHCFLEKKARRSNF